MNFNRKFLGTVVATAGLLMTVLSFQNCSQGSSSSADPSTSSTTSSNTTSSDTTSTSSSSSVTALAYPVTTAVVLVPGQSTTIKVTKPSTMTDLSNYIWYVANDSHALAAHYGLPVENNGSLYISLTLRSDFTGSQDLRVYFYNYSTSTYLDGDGIKIQLNASGTPFASDAVSELCSIRSSYTPTFSLDKTAAVENALTVFDNGAGINSLTCTFTDSSGNSSASVDCLKTSAWPSTWASQTLQVYGRNRCSTSKSQSF